MVAIEIKGNQWQNALKEGNVPWQRDDALSNGSLIDIFTCLKMTSVIIYNSRSLRPVGTLACMMEGMHPGYVHRLSSNGLHLQQEGLAWRGAAPH